MATIPEALAMAIQHHQAGRVQSAEQIYRRILQADPSQAETHNNLGLVLRQQGKLAEAGASFRRALELRPDYPVAHNNLGLVFTDQGMLNDAVACFRRAIELKPDFAEAHGNLGSVLALQENVAEAIACLRCAVELKPAFAIAHYNLGNALSRESRYADAADAFRRAAELEPRFAQAYSNLGNVLSAGGQSEVAVGCYETALRLQPGDSTVHSNLLAALHYCPQTTLARLAEAHAEYDRRHTAPLRAVPPRHPNDRDPDRRLRLGFVSQRFSEHPVGRFLIRPLENLARRDFEIRCYSDTLVKDHLTSRIRRAAEKWVDVGSISDDELARRISGDRIDILFDLSGHAPRARLGLFARKPAPVQITWLDYVGTTGLGAMDYLIADPREVPVGSDPWYREKVLRMPDDYICYDPPADAPPVGPLPALTRGGVTFGSLNILPKLNPPLVALWARILHRVPRSRLLLKNRGWDDPRTCDRFRRLFFDHGIPSDRLDLRGWSRPAETMSVYQEVDLALDPLPYNGGLTTCEALWMGVPVVTCPGETFASRHGLAHLTAAGVTETIAANFDEYADLAVELAQDLPRLDALRAGLRDRVAASPLCDGPRFATHLGQLLRAVWCDWVKSASSGR